MPAPNRIWLAGITYIPRSAGCLYLAVMLDLFSRRVVGWSMSDTMPQDLTIAVLQMAITSMLRCCCSQAVTVPVVRSGSGSMTRPRARSWMMVL